jgi:hypothetical protein
LSPIVDRQGGILFARSAALIVDLLPDRRLPHMAAGCA